MGALGSHGTTYRLTVAFMTTHRGKVSFLLWLDAGRSHKADVAWG